MIKKNIHIAAFSLGLFLFPIVYQPIHSTRHHSYNYSLHDHTGCKHSCSSHSHNTKVTYKEKVTGLYTITEKADHCPICEYQLSINNLLVISTFEYLVRKLNISYNEIVITQFIPSVASKDPPRAPPIYRT